MESEAEDGSGPSMSSSGPRSLRVMHGRRGSGGGGRCGPENLAIEYAKKSKMPPSSAFDLPFPKRKSALCSCPNRKIGVCIQRQKSLYLFK